MGRREAKALLKYTFAASLNEREEDPALFDRRIGKGRMRGWRIGRSVAPRRHIGDFGIGMPGADGIIAGRAAVPPTIAGADRSSFFRRAG